MPELLNIERLTAGYGEAIVLNGVSLDLAEGQSLALLGRNGMGKTTLINSVIGVTRRFAGTVRLDGRDITPLRADRRAHAGIGWVPQERNIFRSLTVEENLTAVARPGAWTLARIYEISGCTSCGLQGFDITLIGVDPAAGLDIKGISGINGVTFGH